MKLELGINCGFAVNKYVEPEEWTRIVGEELGLKHVQFVADQLNPSLPAYYVDTQVERILAASQRYGITIDSVFTGSFTRVNHLMNPDSEARKFWLQWFKNFFLLASRLGAKNGGSHFGILSFASLNDPEKKEYLIQEGIKNWQELSFFVQDLGFDSLIFEPMSVPREMAYSIEDTIDLMDRVNANSGVPMRICLDVGHAPRPDQRDPYLWLERLGAVSPVIHLQQTVLNKSNHWPFIPEYNEIGIIKPDKVLKALEKSGATEALLIFEISHREHMDSDYRIIEDLRASVDYWKPFIESERARS